MMLAMVCIDNINNSKLIDGSGLPKPYIVTMLKCGYCKELSKASAATCCFKSDENVLIGLVRHNYYSKGMKFMKFMKILI